MITLPRSIAAAMGLQQGQRIEWIITTQGLLMKPVREQASIQEAIRSV